MSSPLSSSSSPLVVDFLFFKLDKNEYIIKEVAVADFVGKLLHHVLFRPPYDFNMIEQQSDKGRVCLQQRETVGIIWNAGFRDYSELKKFFETAVPAESDVYVEGAEKVNVLKKIMAGRRIKLIDLNRCDPMMSVDEKCLSHNELHCPFEHEPCAVNKVQRLCRTWKFSLLLYQIIDFIGLVMNVADEGGFRKPSREILQFLPKEYLLNHARYPLPLIYDDLPERYKCDEEFRRKMPCMEHPQYHNGDLAGPYCAKKDCMQCWENDMKDSKISDNST